MLKKFTPAEKGWIMYDWANSAFSAIIAAIILPTFYEGLTSGISRNPWGLSRLQNALIHRVYAHWRGGHGAIGFYR